MTTPQTGGGAEMRQTADRCDVCGETAIAEGRCRRHFAAAGIDRQGATETCSRCGGNLPAPFGSRALDALNQYLVRPDADCPGHLRTDRHGRVLGCGAWTEAAYQREARD